MIQSLPLGAMQCDAMRSEGKAREGESSLRVIVLLVDGHDVGPTALFHAIVGPFEA